MTIDIRFVLYGWAELFLRRMFVRNYRKNYSVVCELQTLKEKVLYIFCTSLAVENFVRGVNKVMTKLMASQRA